MGMRLEKMALMLTVRKHECWQKSPCHGCNDSANCYQIVVMDEPTDPCHGIVQIRTRAVYRVMLYLASESRSGGTNCPSPGCGLLNDSQVHRCNSHTSAALINRKTLSGPESSGF